MATTKSKTKAKTAKAKTAPAKSKKAKAKTTAKPKLDKDPGAPAKGEVRETADLSSAIVLANLGAPGSGIEVSFEAAVAAPIKVDIIKVQAFLDACLKAPRVTYGLGAKVPFFGARPGQDFAQIDCSGFVREAIRRATIPTAKVPDGSVIQHDWVREQQFAKSSVADGGKKDGVVRIAFLRPQDTSSNIGHVVLVHNAKTYESHGGTGPNSRDWTGTGWQEKAYVYVLTKDSDFSMSMGLEMTSAAEVTSAVFAIKKGRRYRATVVLEGLEQFASNEKVASVFEGYGFTNVKVTGSGRRRVAEGTWGGEDLVGEIDPHLTDVVELNA